MSEEQIRAEFEKFMSDRGYSLNYAGDSQYTYNSTQLNWEVWQAAFKAGQAALSAKSVPVGYMINVIDNSWVVVDKEHADEAEKHGFHVKPYYFAPPPPMDDDRVRELEKEVSLWKDRANQLSVVGDGQSMSDYWLKVDALILRNKGVQPEATDQAMKEANQ